MSVTSPLEALRLIARVLSPSTDPAVAQCLRTMLSEDRIDWKLVVRVASQHLVTPALHNRLQLRGLLSLLDQELVEYLAVCAELNRERNLVARRTLLDVARILNKSGIEPLALKGGALLLDDVHGDPAARMLRDLDVLVPPGTHLQAYKALLAERYEPLAARGRFDRHHHHLTPLAQPDGLLPVELHREVLALGLQPLLPSAGVWERARPLQLDGVRLLLPSPEDLLIHNIVHHNHAQWLLWSNWLMLRDAYDLACLVTRHRDLATGEVADRLCRRIGRASVEFYVVRTLELFAIDNGLRRHLEQPGVLRRTRLRWRLHERHADERLLGLQNAAWSAATWLAWLGRFRSAPHRRHLRRKLLRRSDAGVSARE